MAVGGHVALTLTLAGYGPEAILDIMRLIKINAFPFLELWKFNPE